MEIANIPLPSSDKKKRGRRPKKDAKPINSLHAAFEFLSIVQKGIGPIAHTHARIFNHVGTVTNGIVSASCAVEDSLEACPHTINMLAALEQAPGAISITKLSDESLSLMSDDFQAKIALCDSDSLPVIVPDAPFMLVDERLRETLSIVAVLVSDTAQTISQAAIQLREQSALASDNEVILEAWHGLNLPKHTLVPKSFVTALLAVKKHLLSVGFSDISLTVYFEDNSWLQTKLYPADTELPDLDALLNAPSQPFGINPDFFKMLTRLKPFSADNVISFYDKKAHVKGADNNTSAIEEFPAMPQGIALNIKNLLVCKPYMQNVHFGATAQYSMFFSVNQQPPVRGVICHHVG